MDGTAWAWIVTGISIVLLLWIGFKAQPTTKSDAGFLLAGRNLGPFVAACTLMATYYSGWAFIGSPGVAYKYGYIEVLNGAVYLPAIMIVIMVFGKFIRRRAESTGALTIPEYMGQIHGSPAIHLIAAIVSCLLTLVFLVSQAKAMALLMSPVLGIDLTTAAAFMMAIIVVYIMVGGLTAAAWTDVVQAIGMTVAALAILVAVMGIGGFGVLTDRLNAIDPKLVNPPDSTPYGSHKWSIFLPMIFSFIGLLSTPFLANRFMAVQRDIKWHLMALFALPMTAIWLLVPFAGSYARVYAPGLKVPDEAMPTFLGMVFPSWAYPMMAIFILFAMQSTASGVLHNMASTISYDMRKVLFKDRISERTGVTINRIGVVFFGVISVVFTIWAPPYFLIFLGMLGLGTLRAAFVGPMLISLLWRGNSIGALASIIVGGSFTGWALLTNSLGWIESPIAGSILGIVTYVAVSWLTFSIVPRVHIEGQAPATPKEAFGA